MDVYAFFSQDQASSWFDELDADGSGDVDMEEFLAMYKERTTTKAQDIGRLGKETESSRRKHDARTSDNTGGAEMAAFAKQHSHAQTSAELSKANDEYTKRQQAGAVKKFRSIDADGSGTLDREELLAGAKILALTEVTTQ